MQLTKKSPRVLFQVLAFFLTFLASKVKSDHEGSSDPLDWLRDAIPGEPGVDYPILSFVGDTSFSCADRVFGGKIKHFLNSAIYFRMKYWRLQNFPKSKPFFDKFLLPKPLK